MPYLYVTITDKSKMDLPFGPRFTAAEIASAARLEVWASSVSDPGEDYCEFRLIAADDNQIAFRRVSGY